MKRLNNNLFATLCFYWGNQFYTNIIMLFFILFIYKKATDFEFPNSIILFICIYIYKMIRTISFVRNTF